MVPTAVDTMSNRCLVSFISVGLVRNVEGVNRTEVKLSSQVVTITEIYKEQIFETETIVEIEGRLRVIYVTNSKTRQIRITN